MHVTITYIDTRALFLLGTKPYWRPDGNEGADALAKAALHKTKQFYYIPYTDFKYNIFVYLDDILQVE